MRRAAPLALVISCACAAKHAAHAVENTAKKPAKHARTNVLGLVDGATWTWAGQHNADDVTLTTRITGDGTHFHVTGWPTYDLDETRTTEVEIDDGVVLVDGEPWIRISPALASVDCPDTMYCWSVEGQEIYYRTSPDVMVYEVGDDGLTGFRYHHNGTPDDLELHRD